MALLVQKFGGTSVGTTERIEAVADKVCRFRKEGHDVVVVVSAMSGETNRLIALANDIMDEPTPREMDVLVSTGEQVTIALLSMALQKRGCDARSYTGSQVRILTDSSHTKARIKQIDEQRMREDLDAGRVVVVAGFQGIDDNGNITTLGRGGSDLTAVALAAVLGADTCEIYTDVDGVYTTDPRALPEARRVSKASYDEMLELASLGAAVLHPRAVEIARNYGVTMVVRSSWSDEPGTTLTSRNSRPIGREGLETPQGLTKVTHKVKGPTWRPTERMREEDPTLPAVVPPGPDNPLGTHALYLDFPLIRIHGTNKPYGIGRRTSSGCIRMYPESIIELYDKVPSGTQVNVINQEVKVQWIGNELFVEAHPSIEHVNSMEKDGKIPPSEPKEADIAYISRIAGDQVSNLDWDEIRTILSERRGYPIQV
ncbi:aspartate kinase, partial [Marinobacter nauticus]|uniref:aspartate kinase n=1 Tax=Marinobacter nauticus TaxID=2743 RepID=UPI0032B25310